MNEDFKITPWEAVGEIDYNRLIKEFGVSPVNSSILAKFKKLYGSLPLELRRGLFYAHRDFDEILNLLEIKEKIYLYTGRGPSGPMHIGHLFPFIFTKKLQKLFNTLLIIQLTPDEKFLYHHRLNRDRVLMYTIDNARDILALGFKRENTIIIDDIMDIHFLYQLALSVAKRVTFSTAKAVFGFTSDTNIGMIFFMSIQATPAFLGYLIDEDYKGCLIPAAIDQDPYWRVTRDVASKVKLPKPAQIHGKLVPGLKRGMKMSASIPESAIYLEDDENAVRRKIWNAFTGGQPTVALQRKYGGNPDKCVVFDYFKFIFEDSDDALRKRYEDCKSGKLTCGECKSELIERVNRFLNRHRERKSKITEEDIKDFSLHRRFNYEDLMDRYRALR